MGAKKKQGKGKRTAKKSAAKKRARAKPKKPADMVQARSNISNLVRKASDEIAKEVIETAKKGELAPTKYLFELAGLYPVTEATAGKPEAESFAETLMNRLGGLPEPAVAEEEDQEEAEGAAATAAEAVKTDGEGNCAGEASGSTTVKQ